VFEGMMSVEQADVQVIFWGKSRLFISEEFRCRKKGMLYYFHCAFLLSVSLTK
jgi:hypothetical protein